MRKARLDWFDSVSVKALYEKLKPDDYFRNVAPLYLRNIGFYMYLEGDAQRARYIGQAFDKTAAPLARRVRWEIVKDGNGCATSAFYEKCIKFNVNRFGLLLKVSHIRNAQQSGIDVKVDGKFMNAVERALIFEMARSGHQLMNKTGKSKYRLGPIEIVNHGDSSPLPQKIVL